MPLTNFLRFKSLPSSSFTSPSINLSVACFDHIYQFQRIVCVAQGKGKGPFFVATASPSIQLSVFQLKRKLAKLSTQFSLSSPSIHNIEITWCEIFVNTRLKAVAVKTTTAATKSSLICIQQATFNRSILLYIHRCYQRICKIHTHSHPGLGWRSFHMLTSKDIISLLKFDLLS